MERFALNSASWCMRSNSKIRTSRCSWFSDTVPPRRFAALRKKGLYCRDGGKHIPDRLERLERTSPIRCSGNGWRMPRRNSRHPNTVMAEDPKQHPDNVPIPFVWIMAGGALIFIAGVIILFLYYRH